MMRIPKAKKLDFRGLANAWLVIGICVAAGLVLLFFPARANSTPGVYLPLVYNGWPVVRPPTPVNGKLLITEVMPDPPGSDPGPEWFELYNDGGSALILSGYRIGDKQGSTGTEGIVEFPTGVSIQPGQVIVIANRAVDFAALYGHNPDFEYAETDPNVPNLRKVSGSIELGNSGDELLLWDSSHTLSDALAWGNSSWGGFQPPIHNPPANNTLERYPAYMDTDTAADWRAQPSPAPGEVELRPPTPTAAPTSTPTLSPTPAIGSSPTATPTPTSTLTPTPFGGRILLSEVLYDPSGDEPGNEWVELYNPDLVGYPLDGFKLGDEETRGGSEGMFQFPPSATIAAGQLVIIANKASIFAARYGFSPHYEMVESDPNVPNLEKYSAWGSGSINLSNMGDELLLLDGGDRFVDVLAYGNSIFAEFQPPAEGVAETHSLERFPPDLDTNTANDWRELNIPNPGSLSTLPPTATPTLTVTPTTPTPTAPLVINEIHADPHASLGDANGDGITSASDDEFVEIVNSTDWPIDLSNWSLHDAIGIKHTFPISSVIPAHCAIVVFGGGTPTGGFGGSVVQIASSGQLGLNNAGDVVGLYDVSATPVISYSYGVEGNDDQSLTRSPDVTGSDPLLKHLEVPGSAGRRFSPGTHLDGTPFGGCAPLQGGTLPGWSLWSWERMWKK